MNYAALLAVLVVLSLAFPVLVRVANASGVPQANSVVAALLGALLVLAWFLIRQRVNRHREIAARVARVKQRLEQTPNDPEAYFDDNEHLGDLLSGINRKREALEVFERYLKLEATRGRALPGLEARMKRLRDHLDE
jgi:Ca2+/H+ antiporter